MTIGRFWSPFSAWPCVFRKSFIGTTPIRPRLLFANSFNIRKYAAWKAKTTIQLIDVSYIQNVRTKAVMNQHNIRAPSKLRKLSGLKLKGDAKLHVAFSPYHCFDLQSMRIIGAYLHPGTEMKLSHYIAMKEKPLWYLNHNASGGTAVVQSKAKRWIRRGLRLALESHGYDRDGRRVVAPEEDTAIKDIYGTLKITCLDAQKLCQMPFARVLDEMTKVIAAAVPEMRRYNEETARAPAVKRMVTSAGPKNRQEQGHRSAVVKPKGSLMDHEDGIMQRRTGSKGSWDSASDEANMTISHTTKTGKPFVIRKMG